MSIPKLSCLSLAILGSFGFSQAQAAGLDYSKQSIAPFFESGNYGEITYALVNPKIEGQDIKNNRINDMMDSFSLPSAAIKISPTEDSTIAVLYDKPFGVDTQYPKGNMFANDFGTTEARVDTDSVTLLVGGKNQQNIWLYGGLEVQTASAKVTAASPADTPLGEKDTLYQLNFSKNSTAVVPVVGVAYEKPEIALRGAVTYRGAAKHKMVAIENLTLPDPLDKVAGFKNERHALELELPQSVNLDFQTGLSEKHQLLGMVNARWVNWKKFNVSPPKITKTIQEPLASYQKDAYAVEVALGKQISPKLSGEVRVGYDSGTGLPVSLLGPYDRMKSVAIGGQYQINPALNIGAGLQYMWFTGGNVTALNTNTKQQDLIAKMNDGTGYAVGVKLGYRF